MRPFTMGASPPNPRSRLLAPPAHPILVLFLAGAAAAVVFAIGACAAPDTYTPSCTDNVDQFGNHPADNGCNPFAVCPSGNAADCCMADAGVPLTGDDLAICLHGYGDPGCSYLVGTDTATGVSYACSATAPPTPDGG
jgi:hypothetical protein